MINKALAVVETRTDGRKDESEGLAGNVSTVRELQHNKAVALHALGKLGEAIECFKLALQGGLDTADLHNHYAMSLFQHGKKAYGVRHWRRAVELASKELETNPEVVDDLIGYYSNLVGALLQTYEWTLCLAFCALVSLTD